MIAHNGCIVTLMSENNPHATRTSFVVVGNFVGNPKNKTLIFRIIPLYSVGNSEKQKTPKTP